MDFTTDVILGFSADFILDFVMDFIVDFTVDFTADFTEIHWTKKYIQCI